MSHLLDISSWQYKICINYKKIFFKNTFFAIYVKSKYAFKVEIFFKKFHFVFLFIIILVYK